MSGMTLPTYDLAIFDFDGTLADSGGVVLTLVNPMAERFGFRTVTEDEIAVLRGRPNREVIRYLGIPFWKLPLIAREGRKQIGAQVSLIPLFPGVADMLWTLSAAGLRLAVVSSNSETTIRRVLGDELAGLIEFYGCGTSFFGKTRKFRKVARLARVAPSRVIAIGDETRDIEAAKAAGMASGAVSWGYATPQILSRCAPTTMYQTRDEIIFDLTASTRRRGGD
jgi:phosphoglycolate phosphatase